MSNKDACQKFKSKALVPLENASKSCGLCAVNLQCQLPQHRSLINNGRTDYVFERVNAYHAEIAENSRPHRFRKHTTPPSARRK